jgi:hypothetical protein
VGEVDRMKSMGVPIGWEDFMRNIEVRLVLSILLIPQLYLLFVGMAFALDSRMVKLFRVVMI